MKKLLYKWLRLTPVQGEKIKPPKIETVNPSKDYVHVWMQGRLNQFLNSKTDKK